MRKPPLTTREVEAGLKAAGFTQKPSTATSHTKWEKKFVEGGKASKFVVTVDAHLSPFSKTLIASMARQAGLTVEQFYQICSKDGGKKAKKGLFSWLKPASD